MESRRLVRVSMCARIDRNGCGDGEMRVFVCVYVCVRMDVCARVCECLSVSNENSMIYTKENEGERETYQLRTFCGESNVNESRRCERNDLPGRSPLLVR